MSDGLISGRGLPYEIFRDTLYAGRMARDILWEDDKGIGLDEFVVISQT